MKKISFEERKEIGLKILDEIERVCKLINIDFYLAYGTLLGAIRHKGFIPWDDDIDIWMKRADFEKFVAIFNEVSTSDFRILSYHNDDDYPFLASKVVYTKTHVEEKLMKPIKDLGIWVDIFPLDYLNHYSAANTERLIKLEHKRWVALYSVSTVFAKIKLYFYDKIQGDTNKSDFSRKPGAITREINDISRSTEYSEYFRSPTSERSMILFYDSKDFDTTVRVPFENRTYPVPSGYESLLKNIYGNYMQLPPENKRRIDQHLKVAVWK